MFEQVYLNRFKMRDNVWIRPQATPDIPHGVICVRLWWAPNAIASGRIKCLAHTFCVDEVFVRCLDAVCTRHLDHLKNVREPR